MPTNGQPATATEAVHRLQGQDSDQIEVDHSFRPKEGATLLPGVTIGKLLGTGMAVSDEHTAADHQL